MQLEQKVNNIILIGFMGTGKTTVGKMLAQSLGWKYIDTDTLIEQKTKLSISAIFKTYGETHFRNLESEVIQEVIKKNQQVISTGGGIVLRNQNIATMKSNGIVVCLTATPEVIFNRTKSHDYRPLLQVKNPQQQIRELLEERAACYAKADVAIDTSTLLPENIVNHILTILNT